MQGFKNVKYFLLSFITHGLSAIFITVFGDGEKRFITLDKVNTAGTT